MKFSQSSVKLDKETLNALFMFIAPLTARNDEYGRTCTFQGRLHILNFVNVSRRKMGAEYGAPCTLQQGKTYTLPAQISKQGYAPKVCLTNRNSHSSCTMH